MTRDEWFQEMARLIKERDRATAMIENWREKQLGAEMAIEQLTLLTQTGTTPEQAPAPEQEQVSGV